MEAKRAIRFGGIEGLSYRKVTDSLRRSEH